MEQPTNLKAILDALPHLSKEEVHEINKASTNILADLEKAERKAALTEMRRLAKAHGLTFSAKKKPARKRGRPPKAPGADKESA